MSKIEIIVELRKKSNFDACYLIIRYWDFSLDFTERVTFSYKQAMQYCSTSEAKEHTGQRSIPKYSYITLCISFLWIKQSTELYLFAQMALSNIL